MAGRNAREVGPEAEALGSVVRQLRAGADWTQAELAEKSGLTRAMVVAIERGDYAIDAAQMSRLARVFGLRVSEFWQKAGN